MMKYCPEAGFLLCVFANAALALSVMCDCLTLSPTISNSALGFGLAALTSAFLMLMTRAANDGSGGEVSRVNDE